MQEREYWIALNAISGMSAGKKLRLIQHLGSAEEVFRSRGKVISGLEPGSVFAKHLQGENPQDIVNQEEKKASASKISIITLQDREFPYLLREIPDPPLALYVAGSLPLDEAKRLAVVGSRRSSHYGQVITERLTSDLVSQGFWIISGLARGIDSIAHKNTLREGGKTVAVLGSGLDIIYPPENKNLMQQISQSGAVISEFPFGTEPQKMNFPIRNRIISGLCPGLLVIEAGHKSGALISADCALEQGREVMAVPGNITSVNSKGTNQLIKQGARLVEGIDDILEELGIDSARISNPIGSSRPLFPPLTEQEAKIISILSPDDPVSIDFIIQKSGASAGQAHNTLLTLEMKGVIKQLPGKLFLRV